MSNLCDKVRSYLGRSYCPITECQICAEPDGTQRIAMWNAKTLGKQPSQAVLDAVAIVPKPATVDVPSELESIKARLAILEGKSIIGGEG